MARAGHDDFCQQLAAVLGVPKFTRAFELRVAVDEAVTIKCEYYPELPDGSRGELIELVRRLRVADAADGDVTAIGDSAITRQARDHNGSRA